MENSKKVVKPHKNFVKITGQLRYIEEQLKSFQEELTSCTGFHADWLKNQLECGVLHSFVIYGPKHISQEELSQQALNQCPMYKKEEYKFKLNIQSKEEMWFEDLPYEMQKKFGVCYQTTLSYLPTGIKCWKRWGRRSYDMLVPADFPLDRGRRVSEKADVYFENWQIAKDTFFGNESESLKLRKEAIAQEKAEIRLTEEQKASEFYQAHQAEIDAYNEKYRLFRGETKEEYYKCPIFDKLYMRSYYPPELYTEDLFKKSMYSIDKQIEEKKQKEEAEANRKMWQEKLEIIFNKKPDEGKSLVERATDLGYKLLYGTDGVSISQSCYCRQSVKYSDETVFLINQFITQKELELQKQQEQERQRIEYEKKRDEAKALGLPSDIEVWRRIGAGTNCGQGWVIKPDGTLREPTKLDVNKYGDGNVTWEQILPGEVVLSWAKGCATAEHEFNVIYMPKEGLSSAQKEAILSIEENIQETWKNKRGLSSGIPSPDVGMGWNIAGRKTPLRFNKDDMLELIYEDCSKQDAKDESVEEIKKTDAQPAREATLDDIMRLKDFFANR